MKRLRFVGVLLLVGLLIVGCDQSTGVTPTSAPEPTATAETEPTDTPELEPTETPVSEESEPTAYPEPTVVPEEQEPTAYPEAEEEGEAVAWQADGAVAEGEYDHVTDIGEVRLWWSNDADYIYLALRGRTEGWLAIGLDPENQMQGANFLIAAVDADGATLWDAYGQGAVGATHPADEELGGTDDVVAYGASEADGVTVMEVQVPLDSGDAYDKALEPGQTYPVIVAVGSSDDYNSGHTFRGSGEITLD